MIDPSKHNWCGRSCKHFRCWWRGLLNWLSLFTLLVLFVGCGMLPLAPGRASFASATASGQLMQSENPQQESRQSYKRTEEAGKVTEEVNNSIGAAQRDTAREVAAKLGSLKSVVYVGILVFLLGVASFAWPPLNIVVGGSVTTSAIISGAGIALIILPSLIAGNEILILCVALGAAILWWFAHRHGSIHSELKVLKTK